MNRRATATSMAGPARSASSSGSCRRFDAAFHNGRRQPMKLYAFPPSPNTWKVRAVAAYLGQPLDLEIVDLTKGQQRTPQYLALNPTGRTPTLVDGDLK